MKNIERKNIQDLTTINPTTQVIKQIFELGNSNLQTNLLTKSRVMDLQKELKQNFGYQLCNSTMHYLNLYCDYCKKLKQVITAQSRDYSNHKSFLNQFSRSHSQDHVSKIFMGIDNINKKMKKQSISYGKLCLITFFQLQNFSEDDLISFLYNKIVDAKANRQIYFQEVKITRNRNSFIRYEEKQNKIKKCHVFSQSRKNTHEKFNKLHFQILALKVILNNSNPGPLQTNKICQTIKTNLFNLFKKIKIKAVDPNFNLRKKINLKLK